VVTPPPPWAAHEGSSLHLRDLAKAFRAADGAPIPVLDGLSLSVAAGELASLVGPSGCGKSTLLRLIAGLDAPTAGGLWVGEEPITRPSAARGLVFQDPNLFPWLTVRRNIESGLVARGVLGRRRHEVDEYMGLVGLEAFANAYPHQLSGGMAQRAALARALINHPKVLLLDEPLGSLDAFTRMRMQDEVLRLWEARGTTMLLVTHDIDEAIYMSGRIVLLTQRPARVERVIEVPLPRPRQRSDPAFLRLRAEILELLHFAGSAPEGRAGAAPGRESRPGDNGVKPGDNGIIRGG
jgi:NitT/TauT family transport system ATP-binding protein/sulfonate transport system ATP-binding protein